MSTPAYREAKNRLLDTSVQNLLNWADKGAMQLNKLIPALKKIALQDGPNVNVDETWLRYHAYNKKRKTYMWCLVNRKARIVIFFYEDTTDDEGLHIDKIRTELYDLLANPDESRSELMSEALNYLKNFWNQIFAYRNDGEYSIDNMAAERAISPITVQRKNSLFFGCVKGIQNSAIYNTFIETCKQAGVSFRDYFCKLLRELKKGRTDYENLLPMTICK